MHIFVVGLFVNATPGCIMASPLVKPLLYYEAACEGLCINDIISYSSNSGRSLLLCHSKEIINKLHSQFLSSFELHFCWFCSSLRLQLRYHGVGSGSSMCFSETMALSFQPICQHPDCVLWEQPWVSGLQQGFSGLQSWLPQLHQLHGHLRPPTV